MSGLRLELLVGRKVLDCDGRDAGRIEEAIAVREGDNLIITEFHIGAAAFLERVAVAGRVLGLEPKATGYRVPWKELDLSDPHAPRLRCSLQALERLPVSRRGRKTE